MTKVNLDSIVLKSGSHARRSANTVCLMEAVAWVAGEPHSDHPACASPVLSTFARAWNDGMRSDEERVQLKQYVPLLINTAASAEVEEQRAWLALDWLARVSAPAWLRLAKLDSHAEALEKLEPLLSAELASLAQPSLAAAGDAARDAARDAAWDAARAAAWDAARAAAWDAARDAARAAAGAAAWDAARDAAWDAARAAAGAAAGAAARDAARAAAGAAAWDAAWDAARAAARAAAWDAARAAAWDAARAAARAAAGAAAGAAAWDALEPTIKEQQASAHDLFRRMIAVGAKQPTNG